MDELSNLHPHGVFLRREALAAGYRDKDLYAALATGTLSRARHGAYVAGATWRAVGAEARHLMAAHAVGLVHATPFAISHTSAVVAHGMRVWGCDLSRVHVTRSAASVGRRHRDVAYHRGSLTGGAEVSGTPVVSPAEAAFGAACLSNVEAGMVILDSAYDLGMCSKEDLLTQVDAHRGWPGTARLQITLRLAQPGSQSVGESRMRFLFWSHGLPKPELQYVVRDGGRFVGVSDFAWPEHGLLGEFDGRIKYEQLLRPGESPADAVYREKVREDLLREVTGWKVIRFTWSDCSSPDRTAARVRRALGVGS